MQSMNTSELPVLTVSQLNEQVRSLLEQSLPFIALEAEVSNFSRPRSGHWYFSLKDDKAQVRCAMFRFHNQRSIVTPEEGKQVLVRGRVTLYEPRGDYQIIVEHMEPAGEGRLQTAFNQLKNKLKQAGLFENTHKKTLPSIPQRIALITSKSGAAIQDIYNVLQRRAPYLQTQLHPVLVQGETAAPHIIETLQTVDHQRWADIIILARGGGSLEDLWCFNDENLAYALFNCQTPVVTGIGHETDFTICDFVADLRAPTPSAAAELVAPDQQALLQTIAQYQQRLQRHILNQLQQTQQKLDWLHKRLQQAHPQTVVQRQQQKLNLIKQRLSHWQQQCTIQYQQRLAKLQYALSTHHPEQRTQQYHYHLQQLNQRLQQAWQQQYQQTLNRFYYLQRSLQTLSPQATLERGYAIVKDDQQRVVKTGHNLQPQQAITVELADSWVYSTVWSTEHKRQK